MIKSLLSWAVVALCAASAASAGVNDLLPTSNVCAGAKKWTTRLIVADMNGDGGNLSSCTVDGTDSGGVFAETVITCTTKERVGAPVDFALQVFEPTGANLTPAAPDATMSVCNLDPGESVTFITNPSGGIPPPWAPLTAKIVPITSTVLSDCPFGAGMGGCLRHGSARVISTSNKVQCTALRLDMGQRCASGGTAPPVVKNLSLFPKAPAKGD